MQWYYGELKACRIYVWSPVILESQITIKMWRIELELIDFGAGSFADEMEFWFMLLLVSFGTIQKN
jgi:hypothetical protein